MWFDKSRQVIPLDLRAEPLRLAPRPHRTGTGEASARSRLVRLHVHDMDKVVTNYTNCLPSLAAGESRG